LEVPSEGFILSDYVSLGVLLDEVAKGIDLPTSKSMVVSTSGLQDLTVLTAKAIVGEVRLTMILGLSTKLVMTSAFAHIRKTLHKKEILQLEGIVEAEKTKRLEMDW
jgi:hypothetical protein